MIEQGAARHRHQRLWYPVGQRAHAQAETGGEDHGFSGSDGHSGISRTVVPSVFRNSGGWLCDQNTREFVKMTANHTMTIPAAHHWLIAIII
jgi:hypothetical protein